MKCNCGFESKKEDFGELESLESTCFIASLPNKEAGRRFNVGSSEVYICPECGALYCDPSGKIKNTAT